MKNIHRVKIKNHNLISIEGQDAFKFLQKVITTDVYQIKKDNMVPGGILSPQGKLLFDFLIGLKNNIFYIDIDQKISTDFLKKINFYNLNYDVKIKKTESVFIQIIINPENIQKYFQDDLTFYDSRVKKIDFCIRIYSFKEKKYSFYKEEKFWDAIRVKYGLAENTKDFKLGDIFPHNINYDQIGGLFFQKGCYVGQEVISRMHNNIEKIKKRILIGYNNTQLPPSGSLIEANGNTIGNFGTVVGKQGIALVKIDQVNEMIKHKIPITSFGELILLKTPINVSFKLFSY